MEDIKIAMYLRLSMEDRHLQDESNSITNQRYLLNMFVTKSFANEKIIVREYVDDGYSGTSFARPGIQQLLEDTKNGFIDCIVVKDFSRFSRDYIEMGSYLEQIFPFLGIRFISVNDHYDSRTDSTEGSGLDTSFKYLMNDLYTKDISVKVKASLDSKRAKGVYANGSITFGYKKDPEDCHRILIEESEAQIVRRIFQMSGEGYSSTAIAKRLNEEKCKTPIEYKIARGVTDRKPKGRGFAWNSSTICQMLKNEFYAGDYVYDKYKTPEVGGKAHLKPRSEWKIYRNHHEPIISRDLFRAAQVRRKGKGTNIKRREAHPLTGHMICGNCGHSLKLEHTFNPYFTCGTRYQMESPECVSHVNAMFIEQVILFALEKDLLKPMQSVSDAMPGLELTELNANVVDRFINRITVWDEKHIEIEWKF